jgi:hypothetical protein
MKPRIPQITIEPRMAADSAGHDLAADERG